jgi:hypothetical protein
VAIVTVFWGALVVGTGLRWVARSADLRWNSDEGISYLVSSCHVQAFSDMVQPGSRLFGKWVAAAEWQKLIASDGSLCFNTIRSELITNDVHPPLYFWLLHVWTLWFGRSIAAGLALNLLIVCVGLCALFQLAKRVLGSRIEALGVCAIASVNDVAIGAALELRPYALLTTVTVLCVLMLAICCARTKPELRHYAGLVLAAAAGLLTHYLFAFLVPALGLYALLRLVRRDPRRLAALAASMLVGAGLAWAAFPFHRQVRARPRAPVEYPGIDWQGSSVDSILAYLGQPLWVSSLLIAASFSVGVAWFFASRFVSMPSIRMSAFQGWEMLVLFASVALAELVPGALGLSPPHAVGLKYMAALWFLAPFVPVLATRCLVAGRTSGLFALVLLYAAPTLPAGWARAHRYALTQPVLPDERVVIHSVNRLHLPRLLATFEPGAQLLVTDFADINAQRRVLGRDDGFTYASCRASESSAEQRRNLVKKFDRQYARQRRIGHSGKCWALFRYRPSRRSETVPDPR